MSESDKPSPHAAILIIDDDDVVAGQLQSALSAAGYVVGRAGSAAEAMDSLKTTRADLILMNLMLPDTDGLILCSRLRAIFPAPIILHSARATEVDRALAFESGAIDLLTIPTEPDDLLTRIRAVVKPGQAQHTATMQLTNGRARTRRPSDTLPEH
jgi:DNA-binding response OmpR family regulator